MLIYRQRIESVYLARHARFNLTSPLIIHPIHCLPVLSFLPHVCQKHGEGTAEAQRRYGSDTVVIMRGANQSLGMSTAD